MEIRKISLGFAAAALLGASPLMAAAPVTPSVAKIAPMAGYNLGMGARTGARKAHGDSSLTSGAGVALGVLAVAAAGGGVYAGLHGGSNKGANDATSP